MGVRLSHKKFRIYSNHFSADELIILSHGGMTEGSGQATPPHGASVRFYAQHWATGSGGPTAYGLTGQNPNYVPRARSITGPGTPVWNYNLSWGGPGGMRDHERQFIERYANGNGHDDFDLATPVDDYSISLKDMFKAIEKANIHYAVIHYCPCRVVSDKEGGSVLDPNIQRQIDAGTLTFQ